MQYGLTKKLTFLLYESIYTENDFRLEDDICEVIHKMQEEEWSDLYNNYDECIKVLQSLKDEYGQPMYSWIKNVNDFIEYLEYLPVDIAETQIARQVVREATISAYICENGYRDFMSSGF